MIKVSYRDQQWEIPGNQTVREVIEEVGLNPATVLAVRNGKLVLDSEILGSDDELKLIAVISGGSVTLPEEACVSLPTCAHCGQPIRTSARLCILCRL